MLTNANNIGFRILFYKTYFLDIRHSKMLTLYFILGRNRVK